MSGVDVPKLTHQSRGYIANVATPVYIPKYTENMKAEDGAWISEGRTVKFYNELVGGNATLMLDAVKSILEHLDGWALCPDIQMQ